MRTFHVRVVPDPYGPCPPPAGLRAPDVRSGPQRAAPKVLFAKAQFRDQGSIARMVLALEVIEEGAALVNEHQQAAPAMIVLGVGLEMLGQVDDPLGED